MRTISIIEVDYHAEVLRNLCIYLENSEFHVNIYTTEKIWGQVGIFEHVPINFTIFLKTAKTSTARFFNQFKSELNSSDLIFFNTLASNFKYFSHQRFSAPTILRVHNVNAYFGSWYSYQPKMSLFYLWKDFSFFIRRIVLRSEWYYKRKLIEKVDYYMFPDPIITKYAIENYNIPAKKIIKEPFPLIHFEETTPYHDIKEEAITIGIVGAVDIRRRDYNLVYHTIRKILPHLNNKVKLVLLGSSKTQYAKTIKTKFKKLENHKFELISFKGFIEEEKFSFWINKLDFILIPLNTEVRYTIYKERYGYTKISGNINDIIKYGKPAILPAQYPTDKLLDKLISKYHNQADFEKVLFEWIQNVKFLAKSYKGLEKEHGLELVRRKISKTLHTITQN